MNQIQNVFRRDSHRSGKASGGGVRFDDASSPSPVLRVDPASVLIDDMPQRMRDDAVIFTLEALEKYKVEQNIATYVKYRMDTVYSPQFHVVVGRSYGCKVTHEFHMCLLLEFHGLKILIFKAG